MAVALAALAAVAGLLIWRLAAVWLLLFAAVLFGVALRAIALWLVHRTGMPLWAATTIWTLLVLGLLAAFVYFVAASLAGQLADLADRIPRALESLRDWAAGISFLQPVARDVEALIGGEGGAGSGATQYFGRAVDATRVTLSTLANLLVVSVLAIYTALDGGRYAHGLVRLAPPSWRDTARELVDAWGTALPWWLAGRLLSMTVVAVLVYVGLLLTGVPLPLMLGLIAGVFSFVPFLGPLISVVPAVLVALTASTSALIAVLIVYGVVQLLESYLITPLIEKNTVSVPLFPLVAAQLVMGSLLGIGGIMFATPLLLTFAVAVQIIYLKRILGEEVGIWGN